MKHGIHRNSSSGQEKRGAIHKSFRLAKRHPWWEETSCCTGLVQIMLEKWAGHPIPSIKSLASAAGSSSLASLAGAAGSWHKNTLQHPQHSRLTIMMLSPLTDRMRIRTLATISKRKIIAKIQSIRSDRLMN